MLKTEQALPAIRETLDCPQRVVANLLGLEAHTLSNNREKPVSELTPRTGERIVALYHLVVNRYGRGGMDLRGQAILEILQAQVFPDIHDHYDSVVSALHQDKYPLETLLHIADLSYATYQKKAAARYVKLPDAMSA